MLDETLETSGRSYSALARSHSMAAGAEWSTESVRAVAQFQIELFDHEPIGNHVD